MRHGQVSPQWIVYILCAVVLVPTLILTGVLLTRGEQGAFIATVLAVPIGVVAVVLAFIQMLQRAGAVRLDQLRGRTLVVATVATVVASVALPGVTWWLHDRYANVDVDFGPSFEVSEGESYTAAGTLAKPPWRGDLVVTPKLTPVNTLRDCILPARLQITPIVDGQRLALRTARNNERMTMSIPDGSAEVKLEIVLQLPIPQGCVVKVTLAQTYLDR